MLEKEQKTMLKNQFHLVDCLIKTQVMYEGMM